jgi:DHA1 family multidrug resistance protein-like MFS transporter
MWKGKAMLDHATRRRGLTVLLADAFLMYGGFFMLVPLISVHYVQDLHFAAATVGFALALRQMLQQGLALFGGALADRWGAKGLICAGFALRAVGFAGLDWATSFGLLLACCVLAALGGMLFDAPRSAAIAVLSAPAERTRFFTLSGVMGGLGMTIGPLVGALLLSLDFSLVCYSGALCFALAGLISALWLPALRGATERQSMGHGIALAVHDRLFVALTALLAGFWFMWVQLSISLPLAAQRWGVPTLSTPLGELAINGVAWVYALNAGLTVVLQYPLLRLAERRLRPFPLMILGCALTALGLGLIALSSDLAGLLGCVAIFSLGAMLVQPVMQTVTAELADPRAFGAYFGFNALALAFGGGLGNYMGGWLYDLAARLRWPMLPWLIFAGVGALVAVGLLLLNRAQAQQPHDARRAAEPQAMRS